MIGEKEAENSAEAPEMCQADSSTDINQDKVCSEVANTSHTSPKSPPDNAASCCKKDDVEHDQAVDQGCNGTFSKVEDVKLIPSQGLVEVPSHTFSKSSWNEKDNMEHDRFADQARQPMSSKSSPDVVISCNKKGYMERERFADQAHHCLPTPSLCHNGTFSKLEGRSFISSQGRLEGPCQAPYLGYGAQPIGHGNGYRHMTKFSTFPVQRQNGLHRPEDMSKFSSYPVQRQDGLHSPEVRLRSTGQTVYNTDRSKMNDSYNRQRNSKESDELIRGPRAYRMKNFSTPLSDQSCENLLIRREQFNKSDFSIEYKQAKFFMIKSYSEDDIHKSIKYNVWASTPYGNNKLDAAFKNAQVLMKENGAKCPVFLFFSVNASGQFVGLAEMMGPVDFQKSMDFWQQDKWAGFFPVTWHVVKDIPNRQFQSIILENNDNRPVPFSRDTQEIGLPQGLRMLFIFKGFPHGTSVLDDFEFYENREKVLRARRSRMVASQSSGLECNDGSCSLNQLEAAFRNVNVSERPRNAPDRRSFGFDHGSNSSMSYRPRLGPASFNSSVNYRQRQNFQLP